MSTVVQGMSEGTLGVFFQLEALPRDGGFHFCSPGRTGQGGVVETPGQDRHSSGAMPAGGEAVPWSLLLEGSRRASCLPPSPRWLVAVVEIRGNPGTRA